MSYNSNKTYTQMSGMIKVLKMTDSTTEKEMYTEHNPGKYLINIDSDHKISVHALSGNADDIGLDNVYNFPEGMEGWGYMNDNILTEDSTDTEWCSNRAIYKLLSKTNIPHYNITCTVTHGTAYGSAVILKDSTATLLIGSDDGYAVTPNKEDIVVTNAEIASYEILDMIGGNRVCRLTLKHPVGDITVNFPCFKIFKISLKLYGCVFKGPNIILDTKEVRATIDIKDTEYIKKKFEVTGATWNYDDNTHILTLSAATTDVTVDIEYDYRDIEDIQVLMDIFVDVTSKHEDYSVNRRIFNDDSFQLGYRFMYGCNDVLHIHWTVSRVNMHITPNSINCTRPSTWDRDFFHYNGDIAANQVDMTGPWARGATGWDDMGGGRTAVPSMHSMADTIANNFKNDFDNKLQPFFESIHCTHHSRNYHTPDVSQYNHKKFKCRTTGCYFTFTFDSEYLADGGQNTMYVQWIYDSLNAIHRERWDLRTEEARSPAWSQTTGEYTNEYYKLTKFK